MRTVCLLAIGWLFSFAGHAAGPATIAKIDRQLWQQPVDTTDRFDKASRASILVYVQSLQAMQKLSDADMKAAFKIKTVNRASANKWLNKELALSLRNYQSAAKNCEAGDWTCVGHPASTVDLLKHAENFRVSVPETMVRWHDNLQQFSRTYLAEQLRLAALFPTVSSEIDNFNDREWNGDDFADRQFLLTFDDGPTKPHGDSDEVLQMLAANHKSAVFFILGENLQKRLTATDAKTLTELYKGQCVASHGWEHQSHAKWANWQDSITRTQSLLASVLPKRGSVNTGSYLPFFRPPYGQRKADSGPFFQKQGLQVALWNLDSQDWNKQVTGDEIIDRMIALMLIKRHGVLLFHDVHPKAKTALPVLFSELGNAVTWRDCDQPI